MNSIGEKINKISRKLSDSYTYLYDTMLGPSTFDQIYESINNLRQSEEKDFSNKDYRDLITDAKFEKTISIASSAIINDYYTDRLNSTIDVEDNLKKVHIECLNTLDGKEFIMTDILSNKVIRSQKVKTLPNKDELHTFNQLIIFDKAMISSALGNVLEKQHYILKNLCLSNLRDFENINSIAIVQGGREIEYITQNTIKQLQLLYGLNKYDIPLHMFIDGLISPHLQVTNLLFNLKIDSQPVTIKVDKFTDPIKHPLKVSIDTINFEPTRIYQNLILSTKKIASQGRKVLVSFDTDVTGYFMLINKKIGKILLTVTKDKKEYKIKLIQNKYNIIDLTPDMSVENLQQYGIDFSELDKPCKLEFETDYSEIDDIEINILSSKVVKYHNDEMFIENRF